MKLKITTLVIVEEGQVQDIYHSLENNQDKAYQEIIKPGKWDGGLLQFYSLQGLLRNRTYPNPRTNINRIQNRNIRPMKKKSKYTYLTKINGMNTFLLQVNQIPITIQTFNKPLRTPNKNKLKNDTNPIYQSY